MIFSYGTVRHPRILHLKQLNCDGGKSWIILLNCRILQESIASALLQNTADAVLHRGD